MHLEACAGFPSPARKTSGVEVVGQPEQLLAVAWNGMFLRGKPGAKCQGRELGA